MLAEHIRAGRFDLSALVTERIALDGIPAAFENMLAGRGRPGPDRFLAFPGTTGVRRCGGRTAVVPRDHGATARTRA